MTKNAMMMMMIMITDKKESQISLFDNYNKDHRNITENTSQKGVVKNLVILLSNNQMGE